MSGYNEAKHEILTIIDEMVEATSRDIADITDRSIYNASINLSRYHKQGLLNRYRLEGQYHYSLSDRGIERLEWLDELADEEDKFVEATRVAARNRCQVKHPYP